MKEEIDKMASTNDISIKWDSVEGDASGYMPVLTSPFYRGGRAGTRKFRDRKERRYQAYIKVLGVYG